MARRKTNSNNYTNVSKDTKFVTPMKVNENFPTEKTIEIMDRYHKGKDTMLLYEGVLKEILGVDKITPVVLNTATVPEDRKAEYAAAYNEYKKGALGRKE